MKQKFQTFPNVIKKYILCCLGLILLFYSVILVFYLMRGAYIAASYEIELLGRQYERSLASNPNAAPPKTFNITTYDSYENIPDRIREKFPKEKIEPGKFFDVKFKSSEKELAYGEKHLEQFHIIHPYELKDGRIFFFIQNFSRDNNSFVFFEEIAKFSLITLPIAGGIILFFLIVVGILGKRLSDPSRELAVWAQNLTSENLKQPIPNFKFAELNSVANELHGSLVRIDEFVARERDFLRQASHELRTPVTIVSGNVELLEKQNLSAKQISIVGRINRASRNMKQIIETLLWLGREIEPDQSKEDINYPDLLSDVLEDLSYLSQNKNVEHQIIVKNTNTVSASPAALYIVVSNLIRNAFQHTPKGHVEVRLENSVLSIENYLDTQSTHTSRAQGEGVGLNLVQRICTRCGWVCETKPLKNGGMRAVLSLTTEN